MDEKEFELTEGTTLPGSGEGSGRVLVGGADFPLMGKHVMEDMMDEVDAELGDDDGEPEDDDSALDEETTNDAPLDIDEASASGPPVEIANSRKRRR